MAASMIWYAKASQLNSSLPPRKTCSQPNWYAKAFNNLPQMNSSLPPRKMAASRTGKPKQSNNRY